MAAPKQNSGGPYNRYFAAIEYAERDNNSAKLSVVSTRMAAYPAHCKHFSDMNPAYLTICTKPVLHAEHRPSSDFSYTGRASQDQHYSTGGGDFTAKVCRATPSRVRQEFVLSSWL